MGTVKLCETRSAEYASPLIVSAIPNIVSLIPPVRCPKSPGQPPSIRRAI